MSCVTLYRLVVNDLQQMDETQTEIITQLRKAQL